MKPQFLIAAPNSNAGKTTITLTLLRSLQRRGLPVQPFKCGPDYLDPKHHTLAAHRNSINLDAFMMSDSHLLACYAHYTSTAAVSIIEGVMGLFDGAHKMEASSAALAVRLNIPVILVVDASAMAYSAAALLYGYKNFYPALRIAGVIFNFVASPAHYHILAEAATDIGLTPLGYVPELPAIRIPSRHLGLYIPDDPLFETLLDTAADHLEKHIDIDQLLAITTCTAPDLPPAVPVTTGSLRIAVARDAAFNFIYPENIRTLSRLGTITYFSPLQDSQLPAADLLYFPGGYPELHLPALAANTSLLAQLQSYPGKIFAECGGMMYLGQTITASDGSAYPMAGLLPVHTDMRQQQLSIGYRQVIMDDVVLKGHEFHYSQYQLPPSLTETGIRVLNAQGAVQDTPVFRTDRIIASYLHFYFGDHEAGLRKLLGI
ncbi:cobyrinate a,c-diamide synthase [Chitinophaga nivalis]|uniref:Cobyrinate a,c-diamide synthase n=1 Tax=Chitinophaga nivalis TaxID=2991709 RepID=A0ABT3IID6_9BACT|nr:cobyrinate a,c-diamide synthase [Chitinophaga nivalis]MCW3466588.1 cobyrinate a,c-diamide synthase [Chitinophaga nivalis]MCW3483721.1 cobyrinate a,c-diamide synthase [Chitinophaga nivalis]